MAGWLYDLLGGRVRINKVGRDILNLLDDEKLAYEKTQRRIAELARQKINEYNQNQYLLSQEVNTGFDESSGRRFHSSTSKLLSSSFSGSKNW